MNTPLGTYNPPQSIALNVRSGPRLVQPMADRDGGIADAHYTYAALSEDGSAIYRLDHIDEWLPPMSPREKAELFTDQARLPPLREDGGTDLQALAERRRREWAEAR